MNKAEFGESSILPHRVVRVVTKHCQQLGWLDLKINEPIRVKTQLGLSKEGMAMFEAGRDALNATTKQWQQTWREPFPQLQDSLKQIVSQFHLQYPFYLSGYGPADEALTGGYYVPAEEEPFRIPARGTEWPVVPITNGDEYASLPFSALLSWVLTQFALDYEGRNLGRLGLTTLFFQYVPDEGLTLAKAREYQSINGKGTSLHERHRNIDIDPGKPSDGSRMVYLTKKTQVSRDVYPKLTFEIEDCWKSDFGSDVVEQLRASLQSMSKSWESDLPEYPVTTDWMAPYYSPYKIDSGYQTES